MLQCAVRSLPFGEAEDDSDSVWCVVECVYGVGGYDDVESCG